MKEIPLPPRFEAVHVLSGGAVARVVVALDRERGARVVLKIAPSASEEDALALRREFRLLASLDHPSIVKARDFGLTPDGRAWFSMDEVRGPDLASFAKEHALLENLSALVDVAHALDYVHGRGIVHGDVKPTNVRVSGERAFLLDFGLAFVRGEEAEGIRGTPPYVAPEVLRGGRPDRRADLYSLGMTFYEALTGVLPTAGRDLAGILRFHLEEEVPVASQVKPGIPSRLDKLLAHLLEKEPGARYASARPLLEDLGRDFGLVRGSTLDARPELLTPPFVGRGDLMGRFTQALHAAREGSGRAVLVLGADGSGKTRLLSSWRALAQSEACFVVEGRALAGDRTPYRPILDVLSSMTRRGGSAGAGARAALAKAARLAATAVDELPISRLSDERSRLALFEDVLEAFESTRAAQAGERPLVVLLDDLHLADRATLACLAFLAKAVATGRILLVGTARFDPDEEEEQTLSGIRSPLSEICESPWALPSLTEAEVGGAAAGALGAAHLPPDFVRTLHHECRGLPGPLVRILDHYVEARVLVLENGELVVDESQRSKVVHPGATGELLETRISGLPDERKAILSALSIAPSDLSFDLVRRLAEAAGAVAALNGAATDRLVDDLEALSAAGLLVSRARGGEAVWEFASARIRELVLATLGEPERRVLHDAAAAWFEGRLTQRPDFISAAATHALRGGEPERGIRLGLAAAAQAERLFAYDQAATFYAGVLEFLDILGRDAEKSAVRERLGDVHFRAGSWRRALSVYHYLLKEIGTRKDASEPEQRRRAALLTFKVGMIRLRRGDADAARALFDRAEDELAAVGSPDERARLLDASARARIDRGDYEGAEAKARAGLELLGADAPEDLQSLLSCTLGTVAFQKGEWTAAEERLKDAIEQGRRADRPELVRRALSALATTYWKTGRWDESEKLEVECLEEAERSRDLWGITASATNLAIIWCGRGAFQRARPHFERALEIHRRLGAPGGQALAHLNLGECDEILGRWDEAETNYRLMLDILGDDRTQRSVLEARLSLGNLLRKRGDLDRAEKLLAETLEAARDTGDRDLVAAVLYPVALLERERERLDDARRHLDQALAQMESGRTKEGLGRVLFSSAELALRMGELERAGREAARARALAEGLKDRYDLGRLAGTDARLAHALGKRGDVDRLFEEATRTLSEIGALYDLGRCYYEWGVRTDDRAKASARLGTAARLFERIGARSELERARGVLERISTRIAAEEAGASGQGIIGLYEVSRIVNSTRELSAVLDETVDIALRRLNAERGMILLTDPVTGRVSVRVARNLKTGREEEAEAISRSVVDRVVAEGRSILAADARIDPRFVGRESILAHSIVSFLCVPLRVKDRISGAIYVDHRAAARLFSESDKAFLEAFADLAAVAIENARLVEELLEARLRLSVENESLRANLARGSNLDALVGTSETARRIKATLPRAAAGSTTVLIRGESGTGKNLVARILHSLSPRRQGPFIQFNCAALPDTLAESELFGHEKGSFTGADRKKPGRFELAMGGTIFLDEIGKTTLAIQAKLLRVVEDKEFERVGGTVTLKTDAKILAATNLDLEQAITRNEFREDLFYRLNVVPIDLAPLRRRLEDLPLLVEHFVVKLSRDLGSDPRRLDPGVLALFARYPWPGNIRELEATLHRALVLTPADVLTPGDFPWILESPLLKAGEAAFVAAAPPPRAGMADAIGGPIDPETYERVLAGVERDLIERALSESNGRIREAARRLGLARNTLKAKLSKYGLRGQEDASA